MGAILKLRTGVFAPQAGGAVFNRVWRKLLFWSPLHVPAVARASTFLPLLVDYEERLYAAGRIPGGYLRREGRPPERATLISRLIDRPMRPLISPVAAG